MKLIVISNPTAISEEATIINNLLKTGLASFHLRKPNSVEAEVEQLLQQIEEQFHPKIALHQHHQLAVKFDIKSLHYPENLRRQISIKLLKELKNMGFILSTSIHQIENLNQLPFFDYSFYGPVFNSISKKDSLSEISSGFKVLKHDNAPQIIALGGVSDQNINQIKSMNFDGFALLGFIWQQPKNALSNFKGIQQTLKDQNL